MTPTSTTRLAGEAIRMYGTTTCRDCIRSRRVLESADRRYTFIDLEVEPEAATEAEAISGRASTPVIVFPDGMFLVEPTDDELRARLELLEGIERNSRKGKSR